MDGNNQDNETKTENETEVMEEVTTDVTPAPAETVIETVPSPMVSEEDSVEPDMAILTNDASAKSALPIKQYGIAAALILVIGLVLWYGLEQQGRVHTGFFDRASSLLRIEEPAAVINGVKVSKAQYEKSRAQIVASAEQQGLDVTDEKVKAEIDAQTIDVLVNTELLRQAATEAGVEVTPEQVESRYQEVLTSVGGEEELAKRMAEFDITEDSLRSDIEGEILIQTYLKDAVDTSGVTVEDSEIEDAYENAGGAKAGLPSLADVKDQIIAQLKAVKEQQLITDFIKTLKDKATVEVMI